MKSPASDSWDFENSELISNGLGEPTPLIKGIKQEWNVLMDLLGQSESKVPVDETPDSIEGTGDQTDSDNSTASDNSTSTDGNTTADSNQTDPNSDSGSQNTTTNETKTDDNTTDGGDTGNWDLSGETNATRPLVLASNFEMKDEKDSSVSKNKRVELKEI
mmetsp:Transcript_11311/g.19046  ORF Transcript_11311/g.19046 Transcript_11311/m.19046 type:complete len:161 (+) Transcript_11311:732-1214(+)